jgi:anti-sigma regulatory factor (Ser/Thr protein kinase)
MASQPDTLRVVPDSNAVALATQWLEAIAEREEWPPKLGFGLVLSLDEALTNIVSYAFAGGTTDGEAPSVTLSLRREGADLLLEIADNGQPYDPTLAALSPMATGLDDAQIGGHGLRLMRHYLKDLAYCHEHGCNHLTLIAQGA